jgi:hypothetical protein
MSDVHFDAAQRVRVREAVRAEALRPAPPDVALLVDALRARFGGAFVAALFYGSCRQRATSEGIIDLHVLVDDLRAALGPWGAWWCRLLPPSVYYLETSAGPAGDAGDEGDTGSEGAAGTPGAATVRCKYAVLSLRQFRRGCSRAAFHSYFWGRYAQPLTIVGARDPEPLIDGLVDAVETLAARAWPRLDAPTDPVAYWTEALRLSYRAELRPEGSDRPAALVAAYPDFFAATGAAVLATHRDRARRSVRARIDWALRGAWGKLLSLLRLLKGLATFDGGLDYVVWKLERHTGRRIDIPPRVRRHPWLFVWPLVWRHWRDGTFR